MTNSDKIRSLCDEDLAGWLMFYRDICPVAWDDGKKCKGGCYDCLLNWLREEVQEDG